MKIKFLLIAALLLSSCAMQNKNKIDLASNKVEAKQAKASKKNKKNGSFEDLASMVEADDELKTFDFERIFKEANEYFQAASNWEKIKCVPKTAFICTKRECPKIKDIYKDAYLTLDKKNETIAICRGKICNTLNAKFDQTGVFINAWVNAPTGMTVRVLGDNRYKQISMIGLDAYITNGECTQF